MTAKNFLDDRSIHVQFSKLISLIPYDFLTFKFHILLPKLGYFSDSKMWWREELENVSLS